ncbi:MAG: hypothetical protein MZV64_50035 [Ignavibacteriales bacterium]|nr:hypothetical protein [Ignavibacteriales bacterium]
MALAGTEVGPADLASQYPGHSLTSSARPSSANAFSSAGSSLAHSRASRVRPRRSSVSATAFSMAWLRFPKTPLRTSSSSRSRAFASMEMAILALGMAGHLWYYYRSYPAGCQGLRTGRSQHKGRPRGDRDSHCAGREPSHRGARSPFTREGSRCGSRSRSSS